MILEENIVHKCNILAIDTTIGECSVALLVDNKVASCLVEYEFNKQSERLILMIEKVIKLFESGYQSIDYISVCIGPGSFTGVRVGIATANALALILKKQIITVTTFETRARSNKGRTCIAVEVSRDKIYIQNYVDEYPVSSIHLINRSNLQILEKKYKLILSTHVSNKSVYNASTVALIANEHIQNNKNINGVAYPLYV